MRLGNTNHDFALPSHSGPVPTVAWEARREGVEDYRVLRLLESRIKANASASAVDEARRYLVELRSRVSWDIEIDASWASASPRQWAR